LYWPGLCATGCCAASKQFGADLSELLSDPWTFTDRFGTLVDPWHLVRRL
jgi:hypothetical protein